MCNFDGEYEIYKTRFGSALHGSSSPFESWVEYYFVTFAIKEKDETMRELDNYDSDRSHPWRFRKIDLSEENKE